MMAQRAWPLSGDLARAGTAVITSEAVPALLPADMGVSQNTQVTSVRTLPTPGPVG